MSCENIDENGCGLDLDLLTISYQSRVSYATRSGLVKTSNHVRPSTLIRCDNFRSHPEEYVEFGVSIIGPHTLSTSPAPITQITPPHPGT